MADYTGASCVQGICFRCGVSWVGSHTCPPGVPYALLPSESYMQAAWPIGTPSSAHKPVVSEREQWLARGLEQALSWMCDGTGIDPHHATLARRLRRWALRRLIPNEQRRWLGAVLNGSYPSERYPDSPGVKP